MRRSLKKNKGKAGKAKPSRTVRRQSRSCWACVLIESRGLLRESSHFPDWSNYFLCKPNRTVHPLPEVEKKLRPV
jgi:hypothetical protein